MTIHDAARIQVRIGIGTERVPSVQIFHVELPVGIQVEARAGQT